MRSEDASEPPRLPRTPNETLRELLNEGLERFQFVSASDIGVEELADWLAARGVRVPAPQGDAPPKSVTPEQEIEAGGFKVKRFTIADVERAPEQFEIRPDGEIVLRGGASSSGSAPEPGICAHRFDNTVCVAPPGHAGPHITSNAAFVHGLVIGGSCPPAPSPSVSMEQLADEWLEYHAQLTVAEAYKTRPSDYVRRFATWLDLRSRGLDRGSQRPTGESGAAESQAG